MMTLPYLLPECGHSICHGCLSSLLKKESLIQCVEDGYVLGLRYCQGHLPGEDDPAGVPEEPGAAAADQGQVAEEEEFGLLGDPAPEQVRGRLQM